MNLLAKSDPDRLVQLGCFMFDPMVQNVGLESIRVLKHQQCRALKMAYLHIFLHFLISTYSPNVSVTDLNAQPNLSFAKKTHGTLI